MLTPFFWIGLAERAVKSAAQAVLLVIGADKFDVLTADWELYAAAAASAAFLSSLTSLASTKVGDPDSPSVV